jgi:hypothetical protein
MVSKGVPMGTVGAFRSPLHPSGASLKREAFFRLAAALFRGVCLRAQQGLSARPCTLRVSPSLAVRVRGVALGVQDSRPPTPKLPSYVEAGFGVGDRQVCTPSNDPTHPRLYISGDRKNESGS